MTRLFRQAWPLVLLVLFALRLLFAGSSSAAPAAWPGIHGAGLVETVPTSPAAATTTSTVSPAGTGNAVWSDFAPSTWVVTTSTPASVRVYDPDGLNETTAQWRFSSDGGGTWGVWNPADNAFFPTLGVTTTAVVQVSSIPGLVEGTALSQVQFTIQDRGASPAVETSAAYPIKVDLTDPAAPAALTVTPDAWTTTNSFNVSWTNPPDTSSIAGAYYKLDSPPNSETDYDFLGPGTGLTGITVNGEGSHPIYIWLKDGAGNATYANRASATLRLDATSPGAPTGLAASPGSWTATNSFNLSWMNPPDTSGIAGAYYKLDNPPSSYGDGTYVAGSGRTTIGPISVSGDGSHQAYVWLKDEAGNAEPGNRASTTLFLDTAAPTVSNVTSSDHTVNQWSSDNTITLNWSGSDNSGSGIAGYSVLFDTSAATEPGQTVNVTGLTTTSMPRTDGNSHYFHIRAVDNLGNWGPAVHQGPYKIDTTAPAAPTGLTSSDHTVDQPSSDPTIAMSWTAASDGSGSGVSGYIYTWDTSSTTTPLTGTFTTNLSIAGAALTGNQSYWFHLRAQDRAGNLGPTAHAGPFPIDIQAPGAPTNLAVSPGSWTSTNKFSFTWTNPDDYSGIAGVYYRLDSPPTAPDGGTYVAGDNIEALNNLSFSGLAQGEHTLYVWLKDKAGNVNHGNRASVIFKYDTLPPSVSLLLSGTTGSAGWYRSPVQVQLVLTDNNSGPGQAEYSVDGAGWAIGTTFQVSSAGEHTVLYRATDTAGNRSSEQSQTIKIDSEPPQVTLAASGQMGQNGWYNASPVRATLTATDTISGVAQTYYREGSSGSFLTGNQFQVSGEGVHQLYYYAADWAGNGADRVFTSTIRIDTKAPGVIPYAPHPVPEDVWQRTNAFTVTWSAVPDDTSGVAGAYYKLDSAPRSNSDYSGIGTDPLAVRNVHVGSEGKHDIYLWLYDRAGNSNYQTYRPVPRAFWLDQTPPSTTPSEVNSATWYTEPVTITFTAADQVGLSGVKETRYQIIGNTVGPWQTGNVAVVAVDGRLTIWYYSIDNAGNEEAHKHISVKVDLTAPPAPTNLKVSPAGGWQRDGCYTVTWTSPTGASGIARAYYKVGDPPTSNEDFLHVVPAPDGRIDCLKDLPGGKSDLYVWLEDQAGNVDYRNAAVLESAIWWDPAPPQTELSAPAPDGNNDWYTRPVSITLAATDAASGVEATSYRVDTGPWQSGTAFELRTQGTHDIFYSSTDVAGNKESEKSRRVKVDLTPPTAYILPLAEYQPKPSFWVYWHGVDGEPGSNVVSYDVEVLDGTGSWKPWLSGTAATQAEFKGERGHVYYFRARAHDGAGWISPVTTDKSNAPYAYVEPIENGDFETGTLKGWSTEGMVAGQKVSAVTFNGPTGAKSQMALLGDPSFPQLEGVIPKGDAPIQQMIRVPSAEELPDPSIRLELVLDYDIWTCDSISTKGDDGQIEVDSFDAVVVGPSGESKRLIHDGNPYPDVICDPAAENKIPSPQNLGWKRPAPPIDLKPYMGSTIVIRFTTTSRVDGNLNTYTYVDNVTVKPSALPCRFCLKPRVFLPLMLCSSAELCAGGEQQRQMAPPPPVAPTVEPSPPTPGRPPLRR
ncbi:MAG TPA: hypothetical protein DEP84_02445 [Chloroflexi bacterium]|nr:hypothetical protein [Chloroflexota bacterium]